MLSNGWPLKVVQIRSKRFKMAAWRDFEYRLLSFYCHSTWAFAKIFFCKATDQNSSILSRYCLRELVLPTCIFRSFTFNILWIIDNSKWSFILKSWKYGVWDKSQMAAPQVLFLEPLVLPSGSGWKTTCLITVRFVLPSSFLFWNSHGISNTDYWNCWFVAPDPGKLTSLGQIWCCDELWFIFQCT